MLRSQRQKPILGTQLTPGQPITKDLKAFWLLNEGGGNLAKDLVTPAHFNLLGPSWKAPGLYFDGATNYGITPSPQIIDYRTGWSTWVAFVYPVAGGGMYNQFSILKKGWAYSQYGDANGQQLKLNGSPKALRFDLQSGGGNVAYISSAGGTIIDGKWQLVAVTWNGRGEPENIVGQCYIDGRPVTTSYGGGYYSGAESVVVHPYYIGGTEGSYPRCFKGYIAWCGIWKRALTPLELQQLAFEPYLLFKRSYPVAAVIIETGNEPAIGTGYNWSVGSGSVSQKNPVTSIGYNWSVGAGAATQKAPITASGYTWSVGNGVVILPSSGVSYDWSVGAGSISQKAPITSSGYTWSVGTGDVDVLEQEAVSGSGINWSVGTGVVAQLAPISSIGFNWSVGVGALLRARSFGKYDSTNKWLSITIEGTEVIRIKSDGSIDLNGVVNENAF